MREIMDAIDEISGDESLSFHERRVKKKPLYHELDALHDLRLKTPLYCDGCFSSNLDMIYHVGMAS